MPKLNLLTALTTVVLTLVLSGGPARAMDENQRQRFDRILTMNMQELTTAAAELLERKYPDEDWEQYAFPSFVFTSNSVETGYRIAVKEPDLLGRANVTGKTQVIPCYCFCDAMGHNNLLYCFWKDGKPGGAYDDHAAGCNICYGQAMLAFLWHELGATHDEIIAGMEKRFSRLLKRNDAGKH
ncbi:MAG TPA: PCYCGC motif-containing (lipo)protein [Geopsychrobacteraceae bacterium]|jgi:hypothetical protein